MSRRGTHPFSLSAFILLLHLTGVLSQGAILQKKFAPEPLIEAAPAKLVFFDPQPAFCTLDGGCVIETPHNTVPAALAAPLRRHLPVLAARTMVPPQNRWLLASAADLSRTAAILPPPPRVGQPARGVSIPFDLVARADRLHVAAMFLIGTALLLVGTGLGLIVRAPAEPAVPQSEPWIPEEKVLPRLVASPVSPAHLHSGS